MKSTSDTTSHGRPRYLTRREAAAYLRLSPVQLDKLARAGHLRAIRPGCRRVLFDSEALDAFMAGFSQST